MDAEFCKNCPRLETRLLENTHRGSVGQKFPFRTVFIQVLCDNIVMATEPVGKPEFVSDDYAMLCEPNGTCSNIITKQFLSEQMADDYDGAVERAFSRIDGYGENERPQQCSYEFEQEMSEMNR